MDRSPRNNEYSSADLPPSRVPTSLLADLVGFVTLMQQDSGFEKLAMILMSRGCTATSQEETTVTPNLLTSQQVDSTLRLLASLRALIGTDAEMESPSANQEERHVKIADALVSSISMASSTSITAISKRSMGVLGTIGGAADSEDGDSDSSDLYNTEDEDVTLWLKQNFGRRESRDTTGFDVAMHRTASMCSPAAAVGGANRLVTSRPSGTEASLPQESAEEPSSPRSNVSSFPPTKYSRSNTRSFPAFASSNRAQIWLSQVKTPKIANINSPDFDVFEAYEQFGNDVLLVVAMNVFLRYNFISSLEIDITVLHRFFSTLQEFYRVENPYHNRIHAADVLHTTHVYLCVGEVRENFSDVELMSVLFASVVHDVGHLGISNAFLNRARHPLARIYNDQSTLENVHCALAFYILHAPGCNFFASSKAFSRSHYDDFRAMVTKIVLGTDMQHHAEQTKEVHGILEDGRIEDHEVPNLFRAIVHAADLSNPMKPLHIYLKWVDRVMAEFWQQGDEEAKRGMPISILCNRDGVNIAKSQVGFINFVVKPFVKELSPVLPPIWFERMSENLLFLTSMSPDDEATRITAITELACRPWSDAQQIPHGLCLSGTINSGSSNFLGAMYEDVCRNTTDSKYLSPAEMASRIGGEAMTDRKTLPPLSVVIDDGEPPSGSSSIVLSGGDQSQQSLVTVELVTTLQRIVSDAAFSDNPGGSALCEWQAQCAKWMKKIFCLEADRRQQQQQQQQRSPQTVAATATESTLQLPRTLPLCSSSGWFDDDSFIPKCAAARDLICSRAVWIGISPEQLFTSAWISLFITGRQDTQVAEAPSLASAEFSVFAAELVRLISSNERSAGLTPSPASLELHETTPNDTKKLPSPLDSPRRARQVVGFDSSSGDFTPTASSCGGKQAAQQSRRGKGISSSSSVQHVFECLTRIFASSRRSHAHDQPSEGESACDIVGRCGDASSKQTVVRGAPQDGVDAAESDKASKIQGGDLGDLGEKDGHMTLPLFSTTTCIESLHSEGDPCDVIVMEGERAQSESQNGVFSNSTQTHASNMDAARSDEQLLRQENLSALDVFFHRSSTRPSGGAYQHVRMLSTVHRESATKAANLSFSGERVDLSSDRGNGKGQWGHAGRLSTVYALRTTPFEEALRCQVLPPPIWARCVSAPPGHSPRKTDEGDFIVS